MGSTSQRWAGIYFIAQGLAVILWWVVLLAIPSYRPLFFAPRADAVALTKFLVPDVSVLGGSSLSAGWLAIRKSPKASWLARFTLGAMTYALVGALAVNWPIGTCPLADTLMLISCAGTFFAQRQVRA